MKTILMIIILLIPTNVLASDLWTWQDTTLQTTFTFMALLDRSQTLQIKPKGMVEEFSCFMGRRPNHQRVNRLFVTYIISHAILSSILDKPYRTAWQIGFISFESSNVNHNMRMGLGAHLQF